MEHKVIDAQDLVIRFTGDSGDGMQLTGTLFADASALYGNEISTFPDYPAEIRAPQGTVAGVSGFQVHIGQGEVKTPGDYCDVLVAMNPAALMANAKWAKPGASIILDLDAFDEKSMQKAGFKTMDPIAELSWKITILSGLQLPPLPKRVLRIADWIRRLWYVARICLLLVCAILCSADLCILQRSIWRRSLQRSRI